MGQKKLKVVAVAGSVNRPSKTLALVEQILHTLAEAHPIQARVVELGAIAPHLGSAVYRSHLNAIAEAEISAIESADMLIVASPVYRGSYSGLFKHLFDFVEQYAIVGQPVLLAATGGGERHALIIEHQLRPLFGFFEARTLPTAVHVSDRDFTDGRLTAEPTLARLTRAVAQFDALFPEHRRALRAAE